MQRIDRASFVLVAVLTTVAVRSSQAIQCYDCCSLATDHCKEPFTGVGIGTCQGGLCIKTEVMARGKSWVLRRCDRKPFIGEIIAGVKLFGIGASVQVCSTDYCNGPVPPPTSHSPPTPRAPEPTYASVPQPAAPPITSKLQQDSPNAISASSSMSHQQRQRVGVYALLAASAVVVVLVKLQG